MAQLRRSTRQRKQPPRSFAHDEASTPSPRRRHRLYQRKKRSFLEATQTVDDNDLPVVVTPPASFTIIISSSSNDSISVSLSKKGFYDLCIPPEEFRPSATLTTGQCFHWTVMEEEEEDFSRTQDTVQHYEEEEEMGASKTTTKTTPNGIQKKRKPIQRKKESAWGNSNATQWYGVLRVDSETDIVVILRETPDSVWYKTVYVPAHVPEPSSSSTFVRDYLYSYFRISNPHAKNSNHDNTNGMDDDNGGGDDYCCSVPTLYQEWSQQCPRMQIIASCIPGVRILQSDPWECFVSFLCSSNNNIPRITQMLQSIRKTYGQPLCPVPYHITSTLKQHADDNNNVDDDRDKKIPWIYSFPSLQHLHQTATEQDLRQTCGMGYRAKYLIQSMNQLMTLGGESYLHQLRKPPTHTNNNNITNNALHVQNQLIQFPGIGRKVADCIALFALRQDDAIPVDTHVWNIALRDYANDEEDSVEEDEEEDVISKQSYSSIVSLRMAKILTPTVYQRVGDIFRKRFPNKSGWAHSLLFVAELPSFRNALPPHVVQEMDRFRQEEKSKKQKKKSQPKS